VDFERAFDSITRTSITKAMKIFGIPEKIIKLTEEVYRGYACKVEEKGHPFEIKTRVRQGCLLSLILFLMVLDISMTAVVMKDKRD
jgi:hypothetical protein